MVPSSRVIGPIKRTRVTANMFEKKKKSIKVIGKTINLKAREHILTKNQI